MSLVMQSIELFSGMCKVNNWHDATVWHIKSVVASHGYVVVGYQTPPPA